MKYGIGNSETFLLLYKSVENFPGVRTIEIDGADLTYLPSNTRSAGNITISSHLCVGLLTCSQNNNNNNKDPSASSTRSGWLHFICLRVW